jgi:Do/DeqQ family serine protease
MNLSHVLRRWRVTVPAVILTAGALTFGVQSLNSQARSSERAAVNVVSPVVAPAPSADSAPLQTASYADAVARALPAVVTVQVEKRGERTPMNLPDDPFFRRFFGPNTPEDGPPPLQEGLGSGVIVSADGTVLTNNHVVEGAERVIVVLSDGRELQAKIVGTDAPTDLAVLDIEGTNLPTLPLADSNRLRVGDVVLAVGNPLGIGQTVTAGIVSAKGRSTGMSDGYEDFLQTDAPINRGNSGGALITTNGELVGIPSQIVSPSGGNIGIGFAIPSNQAKNVMNQLVATGRVRRGMLGVTVQRVSSDLAQGLGLKSVQGALVSWVESGGPADKAGVEQGDVILRVNGAAVNDSNDLRNRISSVAPGETVTLDIVRDRNERSVRVTLGEVPSGERAAVRSSESRGELGMTLERLTPELARQLRIEGSMTGVVVSAVQPGSAAARAGVNRGDVIRKIDGRDVSTPAQVRDALGQSRDRPAVVVVEREGRSLFLAIPTS